MKQFFSIMMFAFCSVPSMAQWQMQPTPNDTLQPVRNLGGGRVAFSIYAPNAKQVGFGGDNDASWPSVGCACNILDNLLAEGKMKPMVVVMPNGSIPVKNMMDEVPLFEQDLVTSIIPYIEQNYRVVADKAHRAMAGLSMGGMETMETILNDCDKFEYFWVLSAGWFPAQKEQFEGYRQRLNKAAAGI